MPDISVRVEGMRAFARDLGRASPEMRRELGKAYKRVGERLVPFIQRRMIAAAKGRGGTLGAKGIKPSARTTSVSILLSGSNPRTFGDEFGARAWPQFRAWLGNGEEAGYAVWPTLRAREEQIIDEFGNAVEEALKGAFPEGG